MNSGTLLSEQRQALIVTTAIAVITDATLLPFFPKLFGVFGVHSAQTVGLYVALTCLVAMIALPIWAWLEKFSSTLVLLVIGQTGAGLLSIACTQVTDVYAFSGLSLLMIAFKASYLLVYPYVMRLTSPESHESTISLLTVIVHLGGIAGATLGGVILSISTPQSLYYIMALGDVAQLGVCLVLLWKGATAPIVARPTEYVALPWPFLTRLGLTMLVLYFGVFMVRPFFVLHWENVSESNNPVISGVVFSIPALMSLLCLIWQKLIGNVSIKYQIIGLIGTLGLLCQALPSFTALILGRVVYGLAVFFLLVKLDVVLFENIPGSAYARAFGVMNVYQQLGALLAFYTAGLVVENGYTGYPFALSATFIMMSIGFYQWFFAAPRLNIDI